MTGLKRILHKLGVALNLRDPPSLPAHGWAYFDHMVAVYVTMNIDDDRAKAVIEKSRERPYGLTWGDIFLLENIILSLQPVETLCRNSWIVRERFREIAGCSMYDRYVESGIPKETDTPAKVALLRADLSRVLDFLHWYYALVPIREHRRKALTINCIFMVVAYSVVLAIALIYFHHGNHSFLGTGACVLFWGIIGGFVSSQRRMQSIPTDGDPLIGVFGLDNAGYYLWLSPLLGAIFAAILSLLFVGGILQGTVFPTFATLGPKHAGEILFHGDSLFRMGWEALPTSAVEYAKLFTWSFLAGFAERLVPDSLDRLASKLDPAKQPSASPAAMNITGNMAGPDPRSLILAKHPITADSLDDALHTGDASKGADAVDKGRD